MQVSYSYYEDEVRDGFYVPGMMKRAWAAQIEVLEEVAKICKKHNIQYFADAGTLLGAVRHNGFIPWDDDLDICMRREDYERFIRVVNEEIPQGYVVLNIHNEPEYNEMFTRIVNGNNISFDEERLEHFHGVPYAIGIDVFPLDYIAQDEEEEKTRCEMVKIVYDIAKNMTKDTPKDVVKICIEQVESLTGFKIDPKGHIRNQMLHIVDKLYTLYSEHESKYLALIPIWVEYGTNKFDKKWYMKSVELPFENTTIPAPAMYDAILRQKYGDYMKLVRNAGLHDYPFYKQQEAVLIENGVRQEHKYRFDAEALKQGELPSERLQCSNAKRCLDVLKARHSLIGKALEIGNYSVAFNTLCDCQNDAITLGNLVEQAENTGYLSDQMTVPVLEEYCEAVYQYSSVLSQKNEAEQLEDAVKNNIVAGLEQLLTRISDVVTQDLERMKKIIVFLPFKASDWDSLDSVWKREKENPLHEVYVIPVPYYQKNVDGTYREPIYEGAQFPAYVSITSYDAFDFAKMHPDKIYINSPYDEWNDSLTIHPFFYAKNMRQFTSELIYIPYFKTAEIGTGDERLKASLEYFVPMPGLVYADKVIIQSEKMKGEYVDTLVKWAGEDTRKIWEDKILGLGSPKDEYLKSIDKESIVIPEEWRKKILKEDGSYKKIILFEINLSSVLQSEKRIFQKLSEVLSTFKEHQEDIVVIWRSNVLIDNTLYEVNPVLDEEYKKMLREFSDTIFGIYDESGDLNKAVALCDAFYGDTGRAAQQCRMAGKPVMLMNVEV